MVLEVIFETKHKIIPQGAVTYAVNCKGVWQHYRRRKTVSSEISRRREKCF